MNNTTTYVDTCPDNWGFYFSNLVAYNKPASLIIHKRPKPACHKRPTYPGFNGCGNSHPDHKYDYMHIFPQEMYYIFDHLSKNQIDIIVKIIELANLDDLEIDNNTEFWDYIKELVKDFSKDPRKKPAGHHCHNICNEKSNIRKEVSIFNKPIDPHKNCPPHTHHMVPVTKQSYVPIYNKEQVEMHHFHTPSKLEAVKVRQLYSDEEDDTTII